MISILPVGGGGGGGERYGGSALTYQSEEVQHLFFIVASEIELKCQTLPGI